MPTLFRKTLQQGIMTLLQSAVGVGTDPNNYVRTWDSFLHNVDIDEMPFVVVNVKRSTPMAAGEMGTLHEIYAYDVDIYYLDITQETEQFADGEARRDDIMARMEYIIDQNPRLGEIVVPIVPGISEKVYDSNFTEISWDATGQDTYYTFVGEMYLSVDTSKN